MRGLNAILSSASRVMVLRALFEEAPLTGRAVQRRTRLSNRATMLALADLTEFRVVLRERTSTGHLYRLNDRHYLMLKAMRPAFEAEADFWGDLGRTVRRVVRPRPLACVATGPLTRGETDYGGRLILTILFETGRERIRSLSSVGRLAEAIRDRYAMQLDHHLLDTNTMDREEFVPLWRRVEREGILLFGALP